MINIYHLTKRSVLLCCLTLGLNGCGTMTTLKDGGVVGLNDWNKKPEKVIVYPGVISDVGHAIQHGEWYRVLDFPLSFAADTILLPYTIPAALSENADQAEQAKKLQQQHSIESAK